ncbi:helicase-associated domain-containing protein [Brevibacterium gallinarum]|uniref:Helicase-associated domain-containing protein n=1 Tax=Brevibacterium gallinarum TaxID=2762220 RepID=A0ABR8WWX0_9MICO|nr:helicase-associated domain-containing protein [Brevibacterium gallinarum]MBD8021584.1 helicase-associated domain-containing protein [Brevibacterium gallinarum]
MATLTSFAAWLRELPDADFAAFARARRDLMRTDLPRLRDVAAAAGSRSAVATGLESLDTAALQAVHRAACATRVDPAVPAATLAAAPEVVETLQTRGLLWPVGEDAYRTHAETMSLLPTSAAELRTPPDWASATAPADPGSCTRPVAAAIAANAETAAASATVSGVLSAVDAFTSHEVSQLTSGGAGKRDMQVIARALGVSFADAVMLTELAAAAGLLGIGGTELDPRWLPTTAFDTVLAAERSEVYAMLLQTWLTGAVDTTHVLAGRTERGDRLQSLAASAGLHRKAAYAGFPQSQPPLPHARCALLLTLADLTAAADEAGAHLAVPDALLIAHIQWRHPLLAAAGTTTLTRLIEEAALLGLLCTPLADGRAHALTALGRMLAAHLAEAMDAARAVTGFDITAVSVPESIPARVDGILPQLQTQVVVQSDLTAIATGPLAPQIHAALTELAEVDTRGQGTVYRFTETTIADALKSGLRADDITARLREVTGQDTLPQPLEFLITETAGRLGRIQIAAARSVIVVDDEAELAAMLADSALVPAGLTRLSATVAVSNVSRERLAMLLDAAEYQTMAAAPENPAPPRAASLARRPATTRRTTRVPDSRLASYIASLRTGSEEPETDSPSTIADVLREAAATGTEVDLTVVGREGSQRQVRIAPVQVAGGRVRARTGPARDTELTFGLARIISAAPAGTGGVGTTPAPASDTPASGTPTSGTDSEGTDSEDTGSEDSL